MGFYGSRARAPARRGARFPVAPKIDRTVDGITFASKGEATRYATLRLLERAGKIEDLRIQKKFPVEIGGAHFCTYTADFVYFDVALGREVIEDRKSSGTAKDAAYRLRKKAAELHHKINDRRGSVVSQNTSSAVMAQRFEAHDSLDFFPTPPWATRALCEWLGIFGPLREMTAWDPACGECDMARPLSEYFKWVEASDVNDYSLGRGKEQVRVSDFLLQWDHPPHHKKFPRDWIITNPPFRLGQQFAEVAFLRARLGCALLVRTAFLESAERYESLFSFNPPSEVLQFVERVPMFKGRLEPKGSSATAYCWLVWRKGLPIGSTSFHWLAPCRKRLERAGDYPSEELSS